MAHLKPTETLTSKDIRNVGIANEEFGKDKSLLIARPGRDLFGCFWFTVPEGFYALVTSHGADKDYAPGNPVWPSGLYFGPPWLKVSHLVTKQSMMFNTPVKGCKTKDNVTVQIDVALTLRVMGDDPKVIPGDNPQNVRKFVHEVTARGLQTQLYDAQAEAVRTLARSITHTEVFGLRSVSTQELTGVREKLFACAEFTPPTAPGSTPLGEIREVIVEEKLPEEMEEEKDLVGDHDILDEDEAGFNVERGANVTDTMKDRLNAQFKAQGVEILDVIIKQITLPPEIQLQMSQKTMVISQNAEQRMKQKYDMLMLNQSEAIKNLRQFNSEQEMELMENGQLIAMGESLDLALKRAEGKAVLTHIMTQAKVDVAMVNAESNNTVQRIEDRTRLEKNRIILTAELDASKRMTDVRANVQDIEAKAELACSNLSAKGDKAIFNAYGISAPMIRVLNEFKTDRRKLRVQDALASNDKVVITGTSSGKAANQMMLADAALAHAHKGKVNDKARSSMLSEIAVASGKASIRLHAGE
eukprot:CAMPEP_0195526976 /NCGR_PEP_ID=MMETSP0794_2-20130614/28347_1 /TAXON_ID=515487 /ORGANISM="Stephanopyxis turris, Strain CCMP 815" /LENGTH=528 /DNA_ID=CAMNT_0040657779 /DNA_START=75 /DNA_END=1661 /DNA_ORIENTATION=-